MRISGLWLCYRQYLIRLYASFMRNKDKEIQNKEKQNTDLILSESETVRTKVRDNIELDLLCRNQPESAPVMQEIPAVLNENLPLLFILLLWDFFHQIIYTAMQDTCQAQQGFPLRLVNVFLALLILLDGAHRDFCLSCQFRLAHFGQCAQAL